MISLPTTTEMNKAVRNRDRRYDGVFYLAVRTTGIFCRPSCPARKPLAKNVEYFANTQACLDAGYRPCKRCDPTNTRGKAPMWVSTLLASIDENPNRHITDLDLREQGIEPSKARRYFRKHYGMTFQAYQRQLRLGKAKEQLDSGHNILDAGAASGYASDSGFRTAFSKAFGHNPSAPESDCVVMTMLESPVGPLICGATPTGIAVLEFATHEDSVESQLKTIEERLRLPLIAGQNDHLTSLRDELEQYFDGQLQTFMTPLAYEGTPFQQLVWRQLLEIPYGQTMSYAALAAAIGRPKAQRAVGLANGQNKLAIIIPCHRMVNKSGKLGGYAGELWRKQFLLSLEQSHSFSMQEDNITAATT